MVYTIDGGALRPANRETQTRLHRRLTRAPLVASRFVFTTAKAMASVRRALRETLAA